MPIARLIDLVKKKAKAYRIKVYRSSENYTSIRSAFHLEPLKKMDGGGQLGVRKHRGLLVAGKPSDTHPIRVHADVNGAYNIMRRYYKVENHRYEKVIKNGNTPSRPKPVDFFGIFRKAFNTTTQTSSGKTMKEWQRILLTPPQIVDLDSKNPEYNWDWSWQRPNKSFPPSVNPY